MELRNVHSRTLAMVKMAEDIQTANPDWNAKDCLTTARKFFIAAENFIGNEIKTSVGLGEGDFIRCIDNVVKDEGYTACEQLEVGKTYQIVEVTNEGMLKVEDFEVSNPIADPFYPERFTKVETSSSTEINN